MFSNLFKCKKRVVNQDGVIVVAILSVSIVLTIVGVSILSYSLNYFNRVRSNVFFLNAVQVAEAGIEESIYELNRTDDFAGFTTEKELFNNETQGRGVFTSVIVEKVDSNVKEILATGKVYRSETSAEPESTRVIKATAVGTESDGFSVHTGIGGLILGGSASITNSDIYVAGKIRLEGSSKIGTYNQPVKVDVAHNSCPEGGLPGNSYPMVCSSGQSIEMDPSTNIFGSVCATNQTSTGPNPSGNIQPGAPADSTGLQIGCVAPVLQTPPYDRLEHIGRMTVEAPSNSNTYICQGNQNLKQWPDGLRLNGNVSIGSNCNIEILGDVYINGNLSLGGSSRIRVADSVGIERPVVVIDGTVNIAGSAGMISNDQGMGARYISYATNLACGSGCVDLSGNDLRTVQGHETIRVGGSGNLPGMIFQSYWGKVTLTGSGNMGSAIGQTVDMSGSGTVTFGTVLASGTKTWTLSSYQPVFGAEEE
jgi:hypothetical protein